MKQHLALSYYANELYCSVGFVAAGFLIIIVISFALMIIPKIPCYRHEKKQIIMEIGRTTGSEQKYWKRQKRKIFWSLFL